MGCRKQSKVSDSSMLSLQDSVSKKTFLVTRNRGTKQFKPGYEKCQESQESDILKREFWKGGNGTH